jgi:excisionase family DNA binding protein
MQTLQLQVAISLGDDAAEAIASILGPAVTRIVHALANHDEGREARLLASRNAVFGGQKLPENEGWLISPKQAAKLLNVSARTLWRMYHGGEMPQPIRIGRAVRWRLDALKKWVDAGCPALNH